MKFKAKPLFSDNDKEYLEKVLKPYIDEDGYVTGWFVDGAIVGKFIEFENEYTVNEFWCRVDVSTLEPVD